MAGENAPAIMQGMADGDKVDLLLEGSYVGYYEREGGEELQSESDHKWASTEG